MVGSTCEHMNATFAGKKIKNEKRGPVVWLDPGSQQERDILQEILG